MKTKLLAPLLATILCLSLFALPVSASQIEVDIAETPTLQSSESTETEPEPATIPNEEKTEIYPIDITYDTLGTKRYIYKTYKLPEDTAVDCVIKLPYQDDGYNWKNTEVILKETIVNSDSKEISELLEITSDTDDREKVISGLEKTLPYDQNGYSGTLILDESSVEIVAGNQENYSYNYAVSEVREYRGLSSNDMASVPKNIQVNGRSYSLGNVSWEPTDSTGSSGYSDYITGYTAVATYTGTATKSGTNTSDYLVTANYVGEVTKPAVSTNIYTVVYEGTIIPPIPLPSPPYLLFGLGILLLIIAIILFLQLKSNTKIYLLEHGVPRLHHRTRITPSNPVVNIEGLEECRLRIVFTKGIVGKLPERKIYLESDRNNYAVKLGNKLVVQYPPFEKPVLEVNASAPYRYTQPQVVSVPAPDYPPDAMLIQPDSEEVPEENPLEEMLPNIWQEEFGKKIPKSAFNTSDLNEDEMESNDQVFRVYWKGAKENEAKA